MPAAQPESRTADSISAVTFLSSQRRDVRMVSLQVKAPPGWSGFGFMMRNDATAYEAGHAEKSTAAAPTDASGK
jgi:hypothetical protein